MQFKMHLGVLALPNVPFGVTQGARPRGIPIPKVPQGAGEGLTHGGQQDQPGDILIPTARFSLQRERRLLQLKKKKKTKPKKNIYIAEEISLQEGVIAGSGSCPGSYMGSLSPPPPRPIAGI